MRDDAEEREQFFPIILSPLLQNSILSRLHIVHIALIIKQFPILRYASLIVLIVQTAQTAQTIYLFRLLRCEGFQIVRFALIANLPTASNSTIHLFRTNISITKQPSQIGPDGPTSNLRASRYSSCSPNPNLTCDANDELQYAQYADMHLVLHIVNLALKL